MRRAIALAVDRTWVHARPTPGSGASSCRAAECPDEELLSGGDFSAGRCITPR